MTTIITTSVTATPMDSDDSIKHDMIHELASVYPTHSINEISVLFDRCYPDIDSIIDLLDKNIKSEGPKRGGRRYKDRSQHDTPSGEVSEKRRLKAEERQEKKKVRAELKEARQEQKRVRQEEKRKNKDEYKKLKREYRALPKSLIKEALDHYGNKEMLENYLKAMNGQSVGDHVEEVKQGMDAMAIQETKLPSVQYD